VPYYVFGVEPNVFFKEQLKLIPPGKILLAAEGEGRNGVYAALQGWMVSAFDISEEGYSKAMKLAAEKNVVINYQLGDLPSLHFEPESFDALALIYAHFSADVKSYYHQQLIKYLKPGGVVIFEAFSKQHLPYQSRNPQVGGPKDIAMLFSIDELRRDFPDFHISYLAEEVVRLEEGPRHSGEGSVVRFVGKKKSA